MSTVLRTELLTDPLARGYAGMTDTQAASSLNTANRTVERESLERREMFNAPVASEYNALAADKKDNVKLVLSLGGAIDVRTGTNARAVMLDAFGAGTQTRTNIGNIVNQTVSRGVELKIGFVKVGHVKDARA